MSKEEARAAAIPVFDEELRVKKTIETDRVFKGFRRWRGPKLPISNCAQVKQSSSVCRSIACSRLPRPSGTTATQSIVPVVEEIMVIEKRLLLKEEIHIRRQAVVQHVRQPVGLRSEEVSLERQPPADPTTSQPKED